MVDMKSLESFENMEKFLKARNQQVRLRILGYGRIYIDMTFIEIIIYEVMIQIILYMFV